MTAHGSRRAAFPSYRCRSCAPDATDPTTKYRPTQQCMPANPDGCLADRTTPPPDLFCDRPDCPGAATCAVISSQSACRTRSYIPASPPLIRIPVRPRDGIGLHAAESPSTITPRGTVNTPTSVVPWKLASRRIRVRPRLGCDTEYLVSFGGWFRSTASRRLLPYMHSH